MFDPGSNVSLITKSFAKSLGLKGIDTTQLVQVAGHEPESWDTKAYTATLVDNNHGLHKAICFEVDTITSSVARVNINPVVHLIKNIVRSNDTDDAAIRRSGEAFLGYKWIPKDDVIKYQLMSALTNGSMGLSLVLIYA